MDKTVKEWIKTTLKVGYNIDATDDEIQRIDKGLRNNYVVLHDKRIIREIVSSNVSKILLKHRTKENVSQLEDLFLNKLIFRYLTYASMSYRAGIPIATIILCRTASEAGLRQKIAEKRTNDNKDKVWEEMQKLKEMTLRLLIQQADAEDIISKNEIEELFTIDEKMKAVIPNPRNLLDKYIHADLPTIIDFLQAIGLDMSGVIGAKSLIQEKMILAASSQDMIAIFVLTATTRLAERLYLIPLT